MRLPWRLDRSRHGRNRRFVKDYFDAVERFLKPVFIGNAAFNEVDVAADLFEVLTMSG